MSMDYHAVMLDMLVKRAKGKIEELTTEYGFSVVLQAFAQMYGDVAENEQDDDMKRVQDILLSAHEQIFGSRDVLPPTQFGKKHDEPKSD